MAQKVDKSQWRSILDRASKSLVGKRAAIEIAALNLGHQVEAEWLPLLGVTYDPGDDIVEVALEGLDHIISAPRGLHLHLARGALTAIEVVDGEGARHILKFNEPLVLPAS